MNIEEKAKRYAQSVVGERKNYIGDEIYNSHIEYASQCFTAGYTQAVTDLNAENDKLREVLREALQVISDISDPIAYLKIKMPKEGYKFDLHGAVEFSNNGMSISQMAKDALPKLEAKAKQLITEP